MPRKNATTVGTDPSGYEMLPRPLSHQRRPLIRPTVALPTLILLIIALSASSAFLITTLVVLTSFF